MEICIHKREFFYFFSFPICEFRPLVEFCHIANFDNNAFRSESSKAVSVNNPQFYGVRPLIKIVKKAVWLRPSTRVGSSLPGIN